MTLQDHDLIDRLEAFGLPEAEAELYLHLSRLRQAKAAELAHATGRRRPDVYPVLERLTDKGLVQRSTERPTRYVPVDIGTATNRLLDKERTRVRQLTAGAAELQQLWPTTRDDVRPPEDRLAIHQGLAQIIPIIEERAQAARDCIQVAMSPSVLFKFAGLLGIMARKASSDCQVRLLTRLDAEQDLLAMGPLHDACDIRHVSLPSHYEMVLIDGREVFLFLSAGRADSTTGNEEHVLWLSSSDIALSQQAIHDHLWSVGVPLKERLADLDGPLAPGGVEVLRGHRLRCSRMRDAIMRAETEVQCFVDGKETEAWEDSGMASLLRRRAGQGVRVRLSAHEGAVEGLETLPLQRAPNAAIVVVDRREAILGFPSEDGDHTREVCVWTTHPDAVQLVLDAAGASQVVTQNA